MAGGHVDRAPDEGLLDDVLAEAQLPWLDGLGHSMENALDRESVMNGMKGESVAEIPMSALVVLPPNFARKAWDSSHSLNRMESNCWGAALQRAESRQMS